jgi:hypothetical protein
LLIAMGPVTTRKLNRGTLYVFGNVTLEMFLFYMFMWGVGYWVARGFIGMQLLQLAVPLPFVGLVVHPLTLFVMESAVFARAWLAILFAFRADRYVLRPDPVPLPSVIPDPLDL